MSNLSMKQQLLASTIIAGAMAVATPVFAQSGPPAVAPATPASEAGAEIVVTGSRIPHPELTSASPITVVNAAEVKATGTTRIEDLLNSMPQVFAGQGGSISNGATGTATLNLRGLGSRRTLVLVNGKRLVPGDPRNPVADINIIPSALIKTVDVLTGGASSVYGADAVAGVVNFVMDTNFDGLKVDSQYSFYNHSNRAGPDITKALQARGYGYPTGMVTDGATLDTSMILGAGFDDGRGHVTAYATYRKIKAVTQDRRDYSACTVSGNTAAQTTALGRAYTCGGSGTSAPGSFYTGGVYYHVEGNQFIPNKVLYNFAPTNYFQRPDERYTAGFFAHYDVSEALKPYMEFMFMDDRTVAQIAPSGIFFDPLIKMNCDSPLLSAQQRGIICAAGNTSVDSQGVTRGNLYIGRRNVEGGGRRDDLQHTTYRGLIGAKGDITKGISYDGYYQYSRVNFAQTYRNDFSKARTVKALDVVSVGGVPTCRSVVDGTDPNCVPWNIFTAGGVTSAALNYLQIPLFSRGQNSEQIANLSFTFLGGEYGLTSPWASEGFGLNVGGEHRNEVLNFEVDSNFQSGDGAGQGGPTNPLAGNLTVDEFFAEASLPVIQNQPFFEDVRLGAGYRRSKYKLSGKDPATLGATKGGFSTDTYKFELFWSPVRDFTVRGTYNRAVRAPNASELYGSRSFGLDGSIDPCAGAIGSATLTATAAQCALTGVTAARYGSIAANTANQYNGYLGGNAQLTPEIADSITIGLVFTPKFLKGFQATVDFFDIKLKNQISTYGADSIIQECLSSGNPFYCSKIHRNAAGNLFRGTPSLAGGGYIEDLNVNAGKLRTRGIDVTTGYNTRLPNNWGSLGFSLTGTLLLRSTSDPFGNPYFVCVGKFGPNCGQPNPEWRHSARLAYTIAQGSSVSLRWRYFSKVQHEALVGSGSVKTAAVAPGNAKIAAQSYFDLAFSVPVQDKVTLRFGSNNILDKSPPINGLGLGVVENGNTFAQVYDALGRYVYAGVTFDL